MTPFRFPRLGLLFLLIFTGEHFMYAGLSGGTSSGQASTTSVVGWEDYERIRAEINAPKFPARDFVITAYGAKPGAVVTQAVRDAIAACHAAGGGRVVVPAGEWFSGAIHLLSNVNLHVSEGAVIKFSTEPADYPMVLTRWEGVEGMNYSALIYAYEQENVAVTGTGVLDGQASDDNWWSWVNGSETPTKQMRGMRQLFIWGEAGTPVAERVLGDGYFLRPNFIQTYRCENILIEGVTLLRSPMWIIHPVLSKNITVRGVKFVSHGPNNDGCNPESSRRVLIEDCVFDTGDDCIAIKSGRNNDGRRVGVPSENIIVRGCTMKDGHGGVVIGSEISGGCRNVFVEDCQMDSPNLDRALRFKSNARRGGTIENILMRNVRIGRVAREIVTMDLLYQEGANGDHQPIVRNVQLAGITAKSTPRILFVRGFTGAVIEGLRLSDSYFGGLTQPDVIEGAADIRWERVTAEPEGGMPQSSGVKPVPGV